MKRLIVILLLLAVWRGHAATMKFSDYPNTSTISNTWLFLLARPGVTNYNITYAQLTNLLWVDINATSNILKTATINATNDLNTLGNVNLNAASNVLRTATINATNDLNTLANVNLNGASNVLRTATINATNDLKSYVDTSLDGKVNTNDSRNIAPTGRWRFANSSSWTNGEANVGITNFANGNITASGNVQFFGSLTVGDFYSTGVAIADSFTGDGVAVTNINADNILAGTLNAARLPATAALTTGTLAQFAATTSAELAGVLSDEQGSGGGFVRATSPAITTPTLRDAADEINVTLDGDNDILRVTGNIVPDQFSGLGTGVSNVLTVAVVDSTDATSFPLMVDSATGSLQAKTDGGLAYNASSGALTATSFAGAASTTLTGDDEAYDATGWNNDTSLPTKNAVRDRIESISVGGGTNQYYPDTDPDLRIKLGGDSMFWQTFDAGGNRVGYMDTANLVMAAGNVSVGATLTVTNQSGTAGRIAIFGTDGAITATATASTFDFGAGTLEIPNAAGTSALSAGGQVAYNTTDKLLGIHNGTKEVAVSTIYHQAWSFDPKAVCDGTIDRLFLISTDISEPKGIHIIKWKLSFEADPTTELDIDLKRADAFIGVANSAVMDVCDTTAGVSSEATSANINGDAVVANGKVIYLEFGTAYSETGHQCIFELFWEVEED